MKLAQLTNRQRERRRQRHARRVGSPVHSNPVPDTPIGPHSRVVALVPHFECEEWLGDCLESLTGQTRRPDGIVVVDDASGAPPIDIVKRFPDVTLMTTAENGGPYRIIQALIDSTDADVYMFQDADDWSAPTRLETQLEVAAQEKAELIGTWYCMVHLASGTTRTYYFPEEVNEVLRERPTFHALQHPTSLVARSLVTRLGGFATGMRFSGDTEFLRRAGHVARIVNVPEVLYFRRDRDGALTTSPETGLGSPARLAVKEELAARAKANVAAVGAGETPNLDPIRVTEPTRLVHLCGPELAAVTAGALR